MSAMRTAAAKRTATSAPKAATRAGARARWRLPRLDGLRGRLIITVVVVALISAVTATALAYRESRDAVLKRAQSAAVDDFHNRVGQLATELDVPPDLSSLTRFATGVSSGLHGSLVLARYRDYTASSDASADRTRITPELRAAVRTHTRVSLQRVEYGGKPWLVLGAPVGLNSPAPHGASGQPSGVEVFAVVSLAAEERDTADLVRSVQGGLVPVVLLAAVLALLAARTVLRPVRRLARATRRLATGELEHPGRGEGPRRTGRARPHLQRNGRRAGAHRRRAARTGGPGPPLRRRRLP